MNIHLNILNRARAAYANRREPENELLIATVFWDGALVCVAALLVLMCGYGIFQLIGVLQDDAQVSDAVHANTSSLNRTDLKKILDSFGARQSEFDARKASVVPITDPSK